MRRPLGPVTYYALRLYINSAVDGSGNWGTNFVVGGNSSIVNGNLEIIEGKPSIGYTSGGKLYLAISSTADGSGTWSNLTVASEAGYTFYGRPSLDIVDGNPAMACVVDTPSGDDEVRFTRNSEANGFGAWSMQVVDTNAWGNLQMAVIYGRPAAAYMKTPSPVKIVYAVNSEPDASGTWFNHAIGEGGLKDLGEILGQAAVMYTDDDGFHFAR
jgi:hypothetical protein